MAYEEKKTNTEDNSIVSILKLVRIVLKKWWLIVIFILIFSTLGFGIAKLTYEDVYNSTLILNVSNKDKDIAGAAGTYVTASDLQASVGIAKNFQELIIKGNDFGNAISDAVKAKTGKNYPKEQLRQLINVEIPTDSTLIYITVKSNDKDLAYAVSTAIQSVYPDMVKDAFPTANITIADNAAPSTLVADTSTLLYTAAGFLAGAALGLVIVLISSKLQDKILSPEDISKFNIDIIASVPRIKKKKNEKFRLLITDRNVGLPFIETFKLIRTKIENVKLKKGYSVFAVTSSTESEGKTTSSCNIALSLAKSGKSVLLIDGDLRKPAVCKTLGLSLEGEKGLFDIVTGRKSFEESVKYVEKFNLYLLVSSEPVADPSEILASKSMDAIIKEAKKNFDYVIVDCPPAGVVADAAIVANYTDTIIFVTAEERAVVSQIEYALSDLFTTKAEIFGCIYNVANGRILSVGSENRGYGGYYGRYGGYYGHYGHYGHYGSSYYGKSSSKKKKH